MKVEFSPKAKNDLEGIGDYIAADDPHRAVTFVEEVVQKCQGLAETASKFAIRGEFGENVRVLPFGRYLIFFRFFEVAIRIERILHSARDLTKFDI